jgi:dihydroneopterin aldolase
MVGNKQTDTVILAGIQFRGHHGDSEAERTVGGRFEVDLEMARDCAPAGKSDALQDTVDYYAVHQRVMHIGQNERHRLVETLAERIAAAVLAEFQADSVTVRVRKLMPPLDGIVAYAGVEITRAKMITG